MARAPDGGAPRVRRSYDETGEVAMHDSRPAVALRRPTLALLALLAFPAAAAAQQPTVDEIVNRYVQAIGGRDAVLQRTSVRSVGRIEVPAMGMSGTMEILIASPGNMLQKLTVSGFGESQTGVTEGRAWAVDPMQGARLMTGAEADQLLHSADPSTSLRDAKHFSTREVIGQAEHGGVSCIEVRFVWTSGREMVDCYGVEDGLLVATRMSVESPMGTIDVVTLATEYREFEGLRMPTVMVQRMMGAEQRIMLDTVEFGKISQADVAPPAAIRTLLEQGT
jgi:hypothetical protein